MDEVTAPHLKVNVDPDSVEKDFLQILHQVRPFWDKNVVVFETSEKNVSRGLINTMVKCFQKSDVSDAIMIRVHNKSVHWVDRSTEVKFIELLQPLDCAPTIIATFENGFCYHFYNGVILDHTMLKQEQIWRLIATDLAKFHSFECIDDSKEEAASKIETKYQYYWDSCPEKLTDPQKNKIFQRDFPNKEELASEFNALKAEWRELNSPIVLCHNDPRPENIIWNREEQRIHFVDFEAMNYNYQALELAVYFLKYSGITPPDFNLTPSENFQKEWLKCYLEKYYEFSGKDPASVTEKDVQKIFVQVSKFRLMALLMFGVIGCIFEEMKLIKDEDIDVFELSLINIRQYYKEKDRIMAICMPE